MSGNVLKVKHVGSVVPVMNKSMFGSLHPNSLTRKRAKTAARKLQMPKMNLPVRSLS